MQLKHKPGCKCCSPCKFTCSGPFSAILGFILSTDVIDFNNDYGSCDPCLWNLTLPLADRIDDMSDEDLDIDGNCCNFRRQHEGECCDTTFPDLVQITDYGWVSGFFFDYRNILYSCTRLAIAQVASVDAKAKLCRLDGRDYLRLELVYRWSFDFAIGRKSAQYNWKRLHPSEEVVFGGQAGDVNIGCNSIMEALGPDGLAATTTCVCAPAETWDDSVVPCDGKSLRYWVERKYEAEIDITNCSEILDIFPLTFVSVTANLPPPPSVGNPGTLFNPTVTTTGDETTAYVLTWVGFHSDWEVIEPCLPGTVSLEVYGDTGGGGSSYMPTLYFPSSYFPTSYLPGI